LPSNGDAEKIDAECENGVLTIKLPKSEETKPRRLSVKGSNGGNQ
jgi:HSP20 family protein